MARAECLARFAHHELMAVELFAWALLRWPMMPSPMRAGFVGVLAQEQVHCRLYLERLADQFAQSDRTAGGHLARFHQFRRQVVGIEHAIGIEYDHGFDYVAQLADVARIVERLQRRQRFRLEAEGAATGAARDVRQEVLGQERDVALALA